MGIFNKLFSTFGSSENRRNYWYFVKCNNCKEVLKGRIDMQNDLSLVYSSEKNKTSYYCRKVLVGSNRCFRPMEAEFFFDSDRRLLDSKIHGGQFVGEDEYSQNKDTQ